MVFAWFSFGFPMVLHGFRMVSGCCLLWVSYAFRMPFASLSYASIMCCVCLSCVSVMCFLYWSCECSPCRPMIVVCCSYRRHMVLKRCGYVLYGCRMFSMCLSYAFRRLFSFLSHPCHMRFTRPSCALVVYLSHADLCFP